jgi:hypothetical protein
MYVDPRDSPITILWIRSANVIISPSHTPAHYQRERGEEDH